MIDSTGQKLRPTQSKGCVLTLAGGAGRISFRFGAGDLIEMGRGQACAVTLDDRFASRRHCRIGLVPGEGLVLRDLGSANGTSLNGRKVGRSVLCSGDLIEIGAVELRVQIQPGLAEADCLGCGETLPKTRATAAPVACAKCIPDSAGEILSPSVDLPAELAREGYAVVEAVASSGPASLYRGRRIAFAQPVFLKVLPLDAPMSAMEIGRFAEGAQAQATLRHKHIATVYDVRHRRKLLLVVMEDVAGETLRAKLDRGGQRLAVKEALRLTYQIASALTHLYEKGIVHRDIKPANILVTPDGDAKLIDFCRARVVAYERVSGPKDDGESLGTPGYMAPEQIHDAARADGRADIYGLGATLYHCLSGRAAAPDRRRSEARSPLVEVPRAVVGLLMKMVQPAPADRFQTPFALMRAIEAVTTRLTGVTADPSNVDILLRLGDEESDMFLTPVHPVVRPTATFQGQIQDMALVEFLQLLEINGKSGTLNVTERRFTAKIVVREGLVLRAEAGVDCGREVLRRVLDLERGAFSFVSHLVPAPRRDHRTVRIGQLLLDHLRSVDEAAARD